MHLGCKKRLKCCATLWVGLFCIKMMWHFFPFPKRFCFKCFGRRRILKSPLHSFLLCQINPSAFPICLSLKAVQWGCSQTRVIKKTHQQSNGPSGTAGGGGTLIWTPTPTLWVVSLPSPSFYSPPPFYEKPIWLGWGGQSLIFIHACTRTPWPIFNARVLASHHVAMWGSKFITKREVRAMLVNHQQKIQQCYFQLATLEKKNIKVSEGLFDNFMQMLISVIVSF